MDTDEYELMTEMRRLVLRLTDALQLVRIRLECLDIEIANLRQRIKQLELENRHE